MASSKRPPLELDDLTNNLKQSSGKGVDAFFSAPPPPQQEKKPVMQEEQEKQKKVAKQNGTPHAVPQPDAEKRPVKPRHGFDIYWDQYEALLKWSNEEKLQGGTGSMSAMAREALDDYIAKRKKQ
jgi:hypothetical protein